MGVISMPKKIEQFEKETLENGLLLDIEVFKVKDENLYYIGTNEVFPSVSKEFPTIGEAFESFVEDVICDKKYHSDLVEKWGTGIEPKEQK